MSMPDFGTLDVDLRQKVPKNSDFFILPEKSVFCQGKIIDEYDSADIHTSACAASPFIEPPRQIDTGVARISGRTFPGGVVCNHARRERRSSRDVWTTPLLFSLPALLFHPG